jgi:phosphoglycerate dehydrogenase-like enzyme
MIRVAVLDDYQGVALRFADWKSLHPDAQIEAFPEHIADPDTLAKRLHAFECVVLMRERTPLRRALIEKLPNLKLVITTGMQNASVDADALAERGIVFCGTEGVGHATSELAWGLVLSLLRSIPREDRAIRQGRWQTTMGYGAMGKTLGIIGLGRLGSLMAGYAKAFGMEAIAWSRSLTDERAAERGAKRVEKDELFDRADIVTIHVNLNESSRGLVGAAELARMKPTAYLVNTSRGPIVDQAALIAALKGRRIAGAAIDVYDREPVGKEHPYFELDNVVLTPHLGYVIEENLRMNYANAVANIRAFLDGKPIRLVKPRA